MAGLDFSTIFIPGLDWLSLLASEKNHFIFLKNHDSTYEYANSHFIELMGMHKLKDIYKKNDFDLCRSKNKSKIYRDHDEIVLASEKALDISEEVMPKKNERLIKQMSGNLYPVYTDDGKPKAVLGIVTPTFFPFKLSLELALSLSVEEINSLLVKPSYSINAYNYSINLSKREIQCLIELIKGKHAGEIAIALQLKQSTIESYLSTIKNKLGAISKSTLIETVFKEKILQQVIL